MHVRAAAEVPVANVDEAERLEVRDPGLALRVALRRGEPEEELGALGDQVGALDAGRGGKLLWRPRPAGDPATLKALADARQVKETVRVGEERTGGVGDVLPLVASEQERDVVGLEDGRVRVARKPLRVLKRRHGAVGAGGCAPSAPSSTRCASRRSRRASMASRPVTT